jgi:hypothetical protein
MLTLHLNLAQSQVLSQALVQYLEGAGGKGIEGGNVTLAERLLERLSAYMADPDERAAEQAAERGAAADQEMMRKADRAIEHHARLKPELQELIDKTIAERIATDQASLERHQEMMRKQIALFAKAGRLGR